MQAYYMRLRVTEVAEAEALKEALVRHGAHCEQSASVVSILWPAAEADEPDEWGERSFVELIFFLRAWSGDDPRRDLTLLEERPAEAPEEVFRVAS